MSHTAPVQAVILAVAVLGCTSTVAQTVDCRDRSLPAEQRWNPRQVGPELSRFYGLQVELSKAVAGNRDAESVVIANEYLKIAERYPCNWNYGNAIHDGHTVLGLAALKSGDRDGAVRHLREAGKSPGSPQLDSFGPSVALAAALSKAGAFEEVLAYLRDVRRFWKMDEGNLEKWIAELGAARVPDFGFQLARPI